MFLRKISQLPRDRLAYHVKKIYKQNIQYDFNYAKYMYIETEQGIGKYVKKINNGYL